jgi:anaerobic magnesium-protoporphyrin IX monomethyl ester cyclase
LDLFPPRRLDENAHAMTRVLLINPPSPERLGGPLVGLQYVAAALLARGCEVRVIDAAARFFSHSFEWIEGEAETFAPHIIGMGLYTRWVWHAYKLVERMRNRFPLLVAGGPHATACPDEALRQGFDVAVMGEGEETIIQLVQSLEGVAPLESVAGIHFLSSGNKFLSGAPARFIPSLDALPFPHRAQHLFERSWYHTSGWPPISNGIVSSRGCPAHCTFCANYATGRKYRCRSAANVVMELKESRMLFGTTMFPFWDDALTADPRRMLRLCAAMTRDLQFEPSWSATTRVTTVQMKLLSAMKRAGLVQLNFGVESGDDEILRAIRKGIRTESVVRALEMAKEAGLRTSCNFMFGFPQETPQALERTLRFMERIAPLVDFFSPSGVLVPMPATPIYDQYHSEYGFTDWWLREECSRYTPPPDPGSFDDFYRYYINDRNLELDFFRYDEETRQMIRAALRFKAEHNLCRMGLQARPAGHAEVPA